MSKIKAKLLLLFIVITILGCQQDKAKILIIGDSISIGYTPFVQENLENIADVSHNPGNAKHTGVGIDSVETWIGNTDWDIIHFNWGLWDLCYRHPESEVYGNRDKINGKITFSLDEYGKNLDLIIKIIRKKSDAELVFVTTTYVPVDEAGRYKEDAIKYNDIAKKVMKANEVKINDIYEESISIHNKYGKGNDDVHYKKEGSEELGKLISKFLKQEIEQ